VRSLPSTRAVHAPSELMRFGYAFMGAGLAIIK
jgi:hypothetical protein